MIIAQIATMLILLPASIVGLLALTVHSHCVGFNNYRSHGFVFRDDAFRGTRQPAYAHGYAGKHDLHVNLGRVDNKPKQRLSGAWKGSFTLARDAKDVEIWFYYQIKLQTNRDRGTYCEALASINGKMMGDRGVIRKLSGSSSKRDVSVSRTKFSAKLGVLKKGTHEVKLGSFMNKKHLSYEGCQVLYGNFAANINYYPIVTLVQYVRQTLFKYQSDEYFTESKTEQAINDAVEDLKIAHENIRDSGTYPDLYDRRITKIKVEHEKLSRRTKNSSGMKIYVLEARLVLAITGTCTNGCSTSFDIVRTDNSRRRLNLRSGGAGSERHLMASKPTIPNSELTEKQKKEIEKSNAYRFDDVSILEECKKSKGCQI